MTAEAVIAICALGASIYFGWCMRDHNRRSVKPIPYLSPNDYEDEIAVRLWNYGSGPMVLKNVHFRHAKKDLSGHLIDIIPDQPDNLPFEDYTNIKPGRAILPGGCINLIQLSIDEDDPHALTYRDELRDFLGNVSVRVNYTDIYDSWFKAYTRYLDWFQRHKA